jgi:primosomal replication protein N
LKLHNSEKLQISRIQPFTSGIEVISVVNHTLQSQGTAYEVAQRCQVVVKSNIFLSDRYEMSRQQTILANQSLSVDGNNGNVHEG